MTENNLHHKIKMNKKVILVIVAFSIIATPALAFAETPPWWVTATGGIIGGAIGTTGGPIGTIVGATTGAIIADYIYSLTTAQSKSPSTLSASQTQAYTGSVMNATLNTVLENNAQALTEHDLTQTSYYYFAQLMNAVVPQFLSNQTLNETYMGWDSGIYSAMNNISASVIYPLNSMSFNIFDWSILNSYPQSTATTTADITPFIFGNNMSVGSYFWLTPASNFYVAGNSTMILQNVANGNKIYVNITTQNVKAGTSIMSSGGTSSVYTIQNIIEPSFARGSQFGISAGVYEVISEHTLVTPVTSNGYVFYQVDNFQGIMTDSMQLTSKGAISNTFSVGSYMSAPSGVNSLPDYGLFLVSNYGSSNSIWVFNGLTNIYVSSAITAPPYDYNNLNTIPNVLTLLSGLSNSVSGAYQSALSFFNELHSLGYYSASSVPASLLQIAPSTVVPTSMLNGTFNATELQSLFIAYLLQLKSWLNETSTHTLKGNMTVTNSTFNNGFVQVYGNLENNITSSGKVSHYYYNNTWFVPLINLDKWTFKVDSWTNITNNTPDPNFLIVSGSNSGTLINVVNGTFYTEALTVNGTSTSSFTVSPVTIQYVLPHTVSIGKLNNGGFLFSKTAGLQNWELILAGIITVIGIAIVFDRKD